MTWLNIIIQQHKTVLTIALVALFTFFISLSPCYGAGESSESERAPSYFEPGSEGDITEAEETSETEGAESRRLNPLATAAVVTGAVVGTLALAAYATPVYGASLILLSPLGANPDFNDAGNWTLVGGMAALGLYNILVLNDADITRTRRARDNLIGFPLVIVAGHLVNYLTGGKKERDGKAVSTSLLIDDERALLTFQWDF